MNITTTPSPAERADFTLRAELEAWFAAMLEDGNHPHGTPEWEAERQRFVDQDARLALAEPKSMLDLHAQIAAALWGNYEDGRPSGELYRRSVRALEAAGVTWPDEGGSDIAPATAPGDLVWPGLAPAPSIEAMFQQWRELRAGLSSGDPSDDELDAIMQVVSRLEDQIFACPSDSARAVQIKVAITDAGGQLTGSNAELELARQAWSAVES